MKILGQIKSEIQQYFQSSVPLPTGDTYSEWKLKRRIYTYKDRYYPTGKVNSNGEIEYWFDGIQPRVSDEIKNLRLDSKYFMVWHKEPVKFFGPVFTANASLTDFMDETGRSEELMSANEDFSADGNLLFRKTKKGYDKCDMLNTFLTNTLAKTVDDTAIIERFYLTQSELRKRDGLYSNVENVIKDCGDTYFKPEEKTMGSNKSTPLYELYRRTGEVSEKTLFEAQGKEGGDEKKYVVAMIIVAGLSNDKDKKEYTLFAEQLNGKMSDHFIEAHRGPYKGRWWREGLCELLFDHQTAYNELTNEIMRAIPWDSSAFFRHTDIRTKNSIRRGLRRGTLIKSSDLQQVQVNARINEAVVQRNSIIQEMDRIAGSYEVIQGVTPKSGVPLGTTQLMNENANKLYDFLRKKLAVPYRRIYQEFVVPELVKDLKGKDIVRLTGSSEMLDEFRKILAENWYVNNLAIIGPHTPEIKEGLIQEKILELQDSDPLLKNSKEVWKEILPGLKVTVVGESYSTAEVGTIMQLLPAVKDPQLQARMVEYVLGSKGINLPMTEQTAEPVMGGRPEVEEETVAEQQLVPAER